MDTALTTAHKPADRVKFTVDLIDSDIGNSGMAQLRADRDRGTPTFHNTYNMGAASVASNTLIPKELIPWYDHRNNNEPEYLLQLLVENPIALGLVLTKVSILHGQGLSLYRRENGQPVKLHQEEWPEEIQEFYEYNDLNHWAYQSFQDHEMLGNYFSQFIFSKGSAVAGVKKKLLKINRVSPECVRAVDPVIGNIKQYVTTSKWDSRQLKKYKLIEAYNHRKFYDRQTRKFLPGVANASSVLFHGKRNLPKYPHYAPPQWYGARKSIELMNEVPYWHIANIINMFGIRVVISVSQQYLNDHVGKPNPENEDQPYTEREVKDKVRAIFKDYCTNPDNVGKALIMTHEYDHEGHPLKDFIIETVQLDIKDDAYHKMLPIMNSSVTSAFGVDSALAAVITERGMSSGSEKTQAWNIENTKATFARDLVLKPIQFIHRFNGWDSKLFWGFENPNLVTKDIDKSGKTDSVNPKETKPSKE